MSERFIVRLTEALREVAKVDSADPAGNVLDFARTLGVGAFVRSRMAGSPADDPNDAECLLRRLSQEILIDAAREVSTAFSRNGIPHFFFKGAALVERVYFPAEREMDDIDVHIDPAFKENAHDSLLSLGYEIPGDDLQEGPQELRSGLVAFKTTGSGHLGTIDLDMAWGIDPVNRLLARADCVVPREVWDGIDRSGSLPVPADWHHVVLLIHHMVHHDMLHIRGLVDLALLWPRVPKELTHQVEQLAQKLGVLRVTRILANVLNSNLAVKLSGELPYPEGLRSRRLRKMLDPVAWFAWASNAGESEFVEINLHRIRRRALLLDNMWDMPGLISDAVFPPREYLRWRWPEQKSVAGAAMCHWKRVAAKSLKTVLGG